MSDSIAELFARDPLSLTRENIESIIAYYRENREKFVSGIKAPAATKTRAAKPKAEKLTSLTLDELGLGDLSL